MSLLAVRSLSVTFPIQEGWRHRQELRAVDGIDLDIDPGETLAVVGESGCGKTTLARAIVGLVSPSMGTISLNDVPLAVRVQSRGRDARRQIQMIFQDPYESLNPRKSLAQTLAQPLRIHHIVARTELRAEMVRLLEAVGLAPGGQFLQTYPHELSGGQRQRVGIARAIAVRPALVVADEAVSALDVSIRAQVLDTMRDLQRRLGLSYLFITHDLSVVRSLADRIAVMYLGRVVESGHTEEIFARPSHPYTAALMSATPRVDSDASDRRRIVLEGEIPSPLHPPTGCRFRTRCPMATPRCEAPPPDSVVNHGHVSACHYAAQLWSAGLGSNVAALPKPHLDSQQLEIATGGAR